MVSLPIIPDEIDPVIEVGFFEDRWAAFSPEANTYFIYPDARAWFYPAEETPGRGFWAYFQQTCTPPGIIPRQDKEAIIHLNPGWNLIGQPFITPVKWDLDAIQVAVEGSRRSLRDAGDAVHGYAWGWNAASEDYYLVCDKSIIPDAIEMLSPWQAYWIEVTKECDLILPAQQ
jgi:hypothetical protein